MTRNDNSYRSKGRAVFLAAIMVLSMVAVPVAFSGGAAAYPSLSDESYDRQASDGNRIFQGQIAVFNVTDEGANWENDSSIDLYTTTRNDNQARVLDSFVQLESVSGTNGVDRYVTVDTSELNAGSYTLSDDSEGSLVKSDDINFTVTEQTITAEFDSDSATDSGADSEVTYEIASSQRNDYAVNVSADGLSDDDLVQIFNSSYDAFSDGENTSLSNEGNRSSISEAIRNGAGDQYALMDDDEEVLTILNAEEEYTLDFSNIDAGEYDFETTVVDTTASDSDNINVSSVGDADVSFAGDVATTQGDWAEITLEFQNSAEDGEVAIGELDEDGYQFNVTIDDIADDDEVTLYFNTYAAGSGASASNVVRLSEESEDDGASIDITSGQNGEHSDLTSNLDTALDTGSYEIAATASSDDDFTDIFSEGDAVTTLFIEERVEPSINLWTASSGNADEIEDLSDVQSAIENEELTETDTVAADDYLVHEIDAAGISGIIGNNSDYSHDEVDVTDAFVEAIVPDRPRDLDDNTTTNYSLVLEQDNPTSNRDPKRLNLSSSDTTSAMTVLYDKEENVYYALLDVDAAAFHRGNGPTSATPADEDVFNAEFNIKDSFLLQEPAPSSDFNTPRSYEDNVWETASASVEYLDRDGSFNLNDVDGTDYVTVENAEDQEVSGTTNVAPGTEVTVRLRGADGSSFVKSQSDVVVDTDGTFSSTFDFSDRSVDDEFTASLRSGGELANEDGLVVEQAVDEPEDETAPEDDMDDGNESDDMSDDDMSDDMEDDSSSDDSSSDDGGSSSDDTPGFGALVALVAVLGAALLATRRQN